MSATGVRRRAAVLEGLQDDLAVEIDLEIKRRKLSSRDLADRLGYSRRRSYDLTAYLRGTGAPQAFGPALSLRVAQDLGIPVLALTGDDARRASELLGIPLPTACEAVAA